MGVRAWFTAPKSPFQPPPLAYRVLSSPLHALLSLLHRALVSLRGSAGAYDELPIRVVCISDTHTHTPDLPDGDVLIHAGDLTNSGRASEIQAQLDWLDRQSFTYKIAIAGNHDGFLDARSRADSDRGKTLDFRSVKYLQHSQVKLRFPEHGGRELVVFGAPQIPACGGKEFAFQYARGDDAWTETVPEEVDVLVTHTPPKWHLDLPVGLGCEFLLGELWRTRPRLHVFGHVHAGRGKKTVYWDPAQHAYERICARQGWLRLLRFGVWLDAIRVLAYDILGIIWTRVWGSDLEETIMVNSALVDWQNNLRFKAYVVDI